MAALSPAALRWAAWRCLWHRYRTAAGITAVVAEPDEILNGWRLGRPDDALLLDRFQWIVGNALPMGQPRDPAGFNIDVRTNRGPIELWAGWDETRPFDTRKADVVGADLVALLRALIAAETPPLAPIRGPCPVCGGKGTFGPVHVNTGRQPHRRMTVPCQACQGDAVDPDARLIQAPAEEFKAAQAARQPTPAKPAPQGSLFG